MGSEQKPKNVAVMLAGCGVYDGSEIHEAVITLLALSRLGVNVHCIAPDKSQMHVIDHFKGEPSDGEVRSVLAESARIARGAVKSLSQVSANDFDALIIPGGFGVAKNLCDFAVKGADMCVDKDVLAFAQALSGMGKPIGLACIAPVLAPAIFGAGVECTIGNDADTAAAIESMGGVHRACSVDDIVIDAARKLVTTPAYMLAERIDQAAAGLDKLAAAVVELI